MLNESRVHFKVSRRCLFAAFLFSFFTEEEGAGLRFDVRVAEGTESLELFWGRCWRWVVYSCLPRRGEEQLRLFCVDRFVVPPRDDNPYGVAEREGSLQETVIARRNDEAIQMRLWRS